MSTLTLPPPPAAADSARLGPLDNGRLMTPEEFDALSWDDVDDCYLYELVHGVLIVTELVSPTESDPNGELGYLIRLYGTQHPGFVDKTAYNFYISTKTCRRRLDRAIWIGFGRGPRLKHDVPAIAVDFLSAGTKSRRRDYEEKRREYLDLGVKEYWLFDRFRRQLTVFLRRDGVDREQIVAASETYGTPLLPEFVLTVAHILSKADDWNEET